MAQAAVLIGYLHDAKMVPCVQIRMEFQEREGIDMSPVLTGLAELADIELLFPDSIDMYFENLVGVGIVEKVPTYLSDEKRDKPLETVYEKRRSEIYEKGHSNGRHYPVGFVRMYYKVTRYGQMFMRACVGE